MEFGGSTHHDIGELINAQRGIESDKITDRKKWASTLRELLESSYIIDFIDNNSSSDQRSKSRGAALTWTTLFRSVVGYVHKEAEAIAKLEEKPTQTSSGYTTRQTKKKDVGDMFRTFVRAGNKRGPHLHIHEVLDHVTTVLENRKMVTWICTDYTQVLLSYILSVSHYVLQLTSRTWDDLTSLYCSIFLSPHTSCDRTLLAKAIHTLISLSSSQCDIQTVKLYSFFTQALSNISHERNAKVLEYLLASLNIFTITVAANARGRLSKLGEDLLPSLLHLWGRCQPAVKEQVVGFLRAQLRVHHPRGTHTDEEGAWASNDALWKRNLERLHDQIISDFESASRKLRLSGRSDGAQNPELIDLACDVVYQVMYLRDVEASPVEVVQPRGKRRKGQSCWSILRDGLNSNMDNPSVVLWLQLVSWLLAKWPQSLPSAEALPLLSLLHKMVMETKKPDCLQWLFACLHVLSLHPSLSTPTHPSTTEIWRKVWASVLKTVSVHTAEEEGYALLTTLIQQRLVECDLEPWKLLNAAINLPTRHHMEPGLIEFAEVVYRPLVSFLASILSHGSLPESLHPLWTTPLHHDPPSGYPLRAQLLHFLLPTATGVGVALGEGPGAGRELIGGLGRVGDGNGFPAASERSNSLPVELMAHVLVALTQRACSSVQLPFLKSLYLKESPVEYIGQLLGLSGDGDGFVRQWDRVKQVYLESTFDVPLGLPWLDESKGEMISLSRENTIGALQTLLLDLLAKQAEMLLQPIEVEPSVSPQEKAHHLSSLLVSQAALSSLLLHTLILLCHCQALPTPEHLRKTPAIRSIPALLQRISLALRDPLWNEVERQEYHQAARAVMETLRPLVHFCLLQDRQVSASVSKALQLGRKAIGLSFPTDLLETITKLAQGKWPIPPSAPSVVSSNLSLGGSSRGQSVTNSSSFDDEMDLGTTDSGPSVPSETGSTSGTAPVDILSPSSLSSKALCQLEAAQFLCHWYRSSVAVGGGSTNGDATDPHPLGKSFDSQKALLSMLSDDSLDLSKPGNVQLVFKICHILGADRRQQLDVDVLECLLEVLGQLLTVHRRNHSVCRESLRVLSRLARHCRATEGEHAQEQCRAMLSAFWSLYCEGVLCAHVRVELAGCLQAFFQVDPGDLWTSLTLRRKKRKGDTPDESLLLKEALVRMVFDSDHNVRMHMARVIPALYLREREAAALPREEQEEIFQQVSKMLQKAYMVPTDQDDLSVEDESVNRVSSMVTTFLYQASVSPVCERRVVTTLATAIGCNHIDLDLICKALGKLVRYLGYSSTRSFLEDMLVYLVSSWKKDGFPIIDFPCRLLGFDSKEAFFRTYSPQLIPFLVSLCEESLLKTLAELLHTSLPALLQASLPATMVLILTNYAQQDHGDSEESSQERRTKATASHNLLTRLLSEEVVATTIQSSIDEFVIELLVRICEPHTANTHLAKYCRPSDPEPCPPHYTSIAIRATLDYMPSCYGTSAAGTAFIRLLSKRKEPLQKILLALTTRMESTHRAFKKRRLFLAYSLFVSLVCKELESGLDGTQAFVLMDIIHTIVRILTKPEEKGRESVVRELLAPCCDTLMTLCKATVEACPKELARHLRTIITTLVPFAQQHTSEGKQALAVINLLVLKSDSQLLAEHVALLDPFPEVEPFAKLSERQKELREVVGGSSLAHEIQRFLSVGQKCPQSSRTEGLRFLQRLLHDSKSEIDHLIKEGSKGTGSSAVVDLIQGLVWLCSSGGGRGGSTEVARCLGEIGPVDLRCIALPAAREVQGSFDVECLPSGWTHKAKYTAKILHLLTAMLSDRDIDVVRASGDCLRAVLATKAGSSALGNIEEMYLEGEWYVFLEPFKLQKRKKHPGTTPPVLPFTSPSMFPILVNVPDLWTPKGGVSHRDWITRLVTTLIDSGGVSDEVLLLLKPVCQVKVELCEEIFPLLIHNILETGNEDFRSILSKQIRLFFASVGPTHSPTPSSQSTREYQADPDSVTTILNMVMYLRTVDRPKKTRGGSTPWDNNFWLDLDFLDVAMAAQLCSAYFTSLLYIEIWHGANSDVSRNGDPEAMEVEPPALTRQTSQTGSLDDTSVHRLLLEAYSRIGEPDSFYGACAAHSANERTRLLMYVHEGQWHKALSAYNLQMQLPGASCESNLLESLQHLGLTHILHTYLRGRGSPSPQAQQTREVAEYQFEAAWRCSLWENSNSHSLQVPGCPGGYHQSVYGCLTALRDGETSLLQSSLAEARSEVLNALCSSGLESTYGIYPSLSKLLSLLEMEEAGREIGSCSDDLNFLGDWKERLTYLDSDFQFVEPVLALRSSVLHELMNHLSSELRKSESPPIVVRRKVERLFASLSDTLLTQARMAREAGKYQVAEGALFALRHLASQRKSYGIPEGLHPSLPWYLQLEEAKLHWVRGEGALATGLLKTFLQRMERLSEQPLEVSSIYPTALCLYGNWLAETHSESPIVIMENYLEESVRLMEGLHSSDRPSLIEAYLTLARYADNQYQRIKRHMESPTFEAKRQLLQKSKLELQKLASQLPEEARLRNRHVRTLQAQSMEDEMALSSLLEEKQQFLEKALKNYILCLKTGDEYDLRVFRLCALWFSNSSNSKINRIIMEGASQLQSRKFLPLMYQLAARMSARTLPTDPFQQALQQIIHRTTLDHPYHCLYVILALSNASKDDKFPSLGHVTGTKATRSTGRLSRKDSSGVSCTVDEDKVKAASNLITKLRAEKPSLVQAVEKLCDAYIDLAYHDVSAFKKQRGPFKLPASCPLLKLTRMREVAIPTVEIEVDPTCCYDDVVCIEGFDAHFQLAGGINLPKVLSCQGSDGRRRRQLVKGKDDLRQDAVMQQVFVLVNRLLKKELASDKRKLSVRTYRVIPLSQRSGIVEWCEGTVPMGEYLIGSPQNQGAHYRYRPTDYSSMECRRKLMSAGNERKGSKHHIYMEICGRFKPVFHHFFMEQFPIPSEWFERRLAYTRSVAASSIVGYIVGLGDRHVQNILIDTNTAELIHIDLGVAFEQGKTLPTPETVPFRLTRDMVDGMGVAGVEGVFRRCCEETMVVMRASHEELRTIVEVLLHDPLHLWTISPLKALNLQQRPEGEEPSTSTAAGDQIFEGEQTTPCGTNGNGSTNKMAERVLLRLQEKLEGIEDGIPLSVSGQVNHLIQEASDPSNLCHLFPGWQPWI